MLRLALAPALLTLVMTPGLAHAYIGPGAGAGTIAVVLGVIAAVFMAFLGLLWYPIKRLLRSRRSAKPATASAQAQHHTPSDGA